MLVLNSSNRLSTTVICVLYTWAISGIVVLIAPLITQYNIDPTLVLAPRWAKPIIGAFLIIGSTLVLLSGVKWDKTTTAWKLELLGLPLLVSAWGLHATMIILTEGFLLFPIILSVGYLSAVCSRFWKLKHERIEIRKTVEVYQHEHPRPPKEL